MIVGVAKNRKWAWVLVGVIVILALTILGLVGYFGWKMATTKVPSCQAKDLKLAVNQDASLKGINYYKAVLTNNSGSVCSLNGYPTVSMVDDKDVRVGASDAQYSDAFAAATVNLAANGGQAYALIGFPNSDSFSPGVCSKKSENLKLYLPGTTVANKQSALSAALRQQVCPGFSVAVFQPGS